MHATFLSNRGYITFIFPSCRDGIDVFVIVKLLVLMWFCCAVRKIQYCTEAIKLSFFEKEALVVNIGFSGHQISTTIVSSVEDIGVQNTYQISSTDCTIKEKACNILLL